MSKRQRMTGNIVLCDTEEPITTELDEVQKRIRERAFEISLNRNHAAREIDDWLDAESEVTLLPPVEVAEKDDQLMITISAAGIDPQDLKIFATRSQILVKGHLRHDHEPDAQIHVCEFRSRTLFRPVRLPASIDLRTLETEFRDGMLRISARREGVKTETVAKEEAVKKKPARKTVARRKKTA